MFETHCSERAVRNGVCFLQLYLWHDHASNIGGTTDMCGAKIQIEGAGSPHIRNRTKMEESIRPNKRPLDEACDAAENSSGSPRKRNKVAETTEQHEDEPALDRISDPTKFVRVPSIAGGTFSSYSEVEAAIRNYALSTHQVHVH